MGIWEKSTLGTEISVCLMHWILSARKKEKLKMTRVRKATHSCFSGTKVK